MSYTEIALWVAIPVRLVTLTVDQRLNSLQLCRPLASSYLKYRPISGRSTPCFREVVPLVMESAGHQVSREKEPLKTGVSMDTLKRSQIIAVFCTGLTVIGVT